MNNQNNKRNARSILKVLMYHYKSRGLVSLAKKIFTKTGLLNGYYKAKLDNILLRHRGLKVIISPPCFAWNIPLYQRPQHLATNLAEQGFVYFFCTTNGIYEQIYGFREVSDGCYVTDQIALLSRIKNKVIHLYSTDTINLIPQIEKIVSDNDILLYDYFDEIHEDISKTIISESYIEKHKYLINHPRSIVTASATKLMKNVISINPQKSPILVTNGVEVEHFSNTDNSHFPPDALKDIVSTNDIIIGYFGAMAKWFDYELVKKIALEKAYQICLIGWEYDESLKDSGISEFNNIHIIDTVNYKVLPNYARYFHVTIIPFLVNKITLSTSPIKLFEYMALRKPIVATDLPECRKYKSALVATDHDDFLRKIRTAISLINDNEYLAVLASEANNNSWRSKAKIIADAINNEKTQPEYQVS